MRNKYGHTGLRMCIRTEATVEQGTTNHIHNIDAGEKVFTDYDFYFRTPVYKAWIEILFMLRIKISRFFPFIFIFFLLPRYIFCCCSEGCVCVFHTPLKTSVQFSIQYNAAVIEYVFIATSNECCAVCVAKQSLFEGNIFTPVVGMK